MNEKKIANRVARKVLAAMQREALGDGGLDRRTLTQLVQQTGEGAELVNWKDLKVNSEVSSEAKKFAAALYKALNKWDKDHPDSIVTSVDEIFDDDGAYAVLMTLRGEGVGIWDGRWDKHFTDDNDIKELERYLKRVLGSFADDTGSGSLEYAFLDAAMEQGSY